MHRATRPLLAVAAVLALAGCGVGANAAAPTWVPMPSFQGEGQAPSITPTIALPSAPTPSGSSSAASPANNDDPAVVATNLAAPDGIALLPDGTALVGERTTGRIVQVQPTPHEPVRTIRTLTGLSTVGGGGLLDLALSPTYSQDSLIFAYITTPTDNRVVDFTLTGPVTPVLTGIPTGPSDNAGRLLFGPDNQLYVGTGDAGQPSQAANPQSLAGKVLRVTDIGQPSDGNPNPASPVFTSGHRDVVGLCADPSSGLLVEVEPDSVGGRNNVNILTKGSDYGWPTPSAQTPKPLASLPSGFSSPGACALTQGELYVTSLDGKALLGGQVTAGSSGISISKFTPFLQNRYGRLLNVVVAPDGYLWLTTSNRDGHGKPIATDERVLRIPPPTNASDNYPG